MIAIHLLEYSLGLYLLMEELCRNPIHKGYFDVGRVSLWMGRHNSSINRYQLSCCRSDRATLPKIKRLKNLFTLHNIKLTLVYTLGYYYPVE